MPFIHKPMLSRCFYNDLTVNAFDLIIYFGNIFNIYRGRYVGIFTKITMKSDYETYIVYIYIHVYVYYVQHFKY